MMNGSTPSSSRCVVPPIRKEWPETADEPWEAQMELHWARNQLFFIGHHEPSRVSKANNGAESGTRELEKRCHLRARQALFAHSESVNSSQSP